MKERFKKVGSHYLLAAGSLLFVTAAIHWDVLCHLSTRVLAGQQVGGYFAWLFWWWSYALKEGLPLFHTGMIMYPTGVPVFPHSPVNELPAVLLQLITTPYASVNLLLICSYALTGISAYALLYRLTRNGWASFYGAFTYAFSAYMIVQHFHGQVIEATLYFNPLLALAWLRYLESPGPARAAWFGAALLGVFLSGPYVAFSFGLVFLSAAFVWDSIGERRLRSPGTGRPLLLAVLVSGGIAAAFYWPLLRYAGEWIGARSFYSVSLASFFDLPFWHSSGFIQSMRILKDSGTAPERAMAYLGIGTYALIAYGLWDKRLRRDPAYRFWLWIGAFAAILCLGPWLQFVPGRETAVPLPYLVFIKIPLLSSFRNAGRILMTVTLAASVLAALSLSRLMQERGRAFGAALCVLLTAFIFWEFDLGRIGERFVSSAPTGVYRQIRDDPAKDFAILELPISYDAAGNLFIYAQYYMLFQPFHHRPMVLGYPSRHLPDSLAFAENTDLVFELTHPGMLRRLDVEPKLRGRARWLEAEGARALREAGIKYVVYHTRVPAYDEETRHEIGTWLRRTLGPPVMEDEEGDLLFSSERKNPPLGSHSQGPRW